MKRHDEGDFWYEISQMPDPIAKGVWVRKYSIKCRYCGREASCGANGMSNEHMRKAFTRQGWDIGNRKTRHKCPDCMKRSHVERVEAPARAPEPAPASAPPDNVVPFPIAQSDLFCLFCHRRADQVQLKSSADASICYECVEVFSLEIAEERFKPRVTTPPVINREEAEAFVAAVKAEESPRLVTFYKVLEPGLTGLDWDEIITEDELLRAQEKYGRDAFTVIASHHHTIDPVKHPHGIPFIITRVQKERLKKEGFSDQQIKEMTPQQAHDLLMALSKSTTAEISKIKHNWHTGSSIDRMPVEANAPAPAKSQVAIPGSETEKTETQLDTFLREVKALAKQEYPPEPTSTPVEDDNQPADWWIKLQQKNQKKSRKKRLDEST